MRRVDAKAIRFAFGSALRDIRSKAGLSQETLAQKANLNRTYVGDVERGERNISIVNIVKLCRALRVDLPQFFREVQKHLV